MQGGVPRGDGEGWKRVNESPIYCFLSCLLVGADPLDIGTLLASMEEASLAYILLREGVKLLQNIFRWFLRMTEPQG